jgi:tetratricopeptide (TPR) repeat protein
MAATTLGQRIREIRMGKGLTQIDLSKGICTPSMISQIESDRARPSYRILFSIADKLNVPLEKLLSDVDLNLEYVSNYKMSRAMVAAKEYTSAIPLLIELLEKPRGQLSTSDIMHDLAECYVNTQQYDKAKEQLEQLKELAILRNDYQLHALLLKNYGLIEFQLKNYQLAAFQWQKALEEVEKMEQEDVYLKASILYNLGLVYKTLGCVNDSITYYDHAAELLSFSAQNPHEIANAYLNLGMVYRKIGNLDQAVKYSEQAIGMYECSENQLTVLKTKVQTAALYVQMGRTEEALCMLEESVQKFRDLGNREEEGITTVEMAKLKLMMHEYDQAEELCQRARNLLPELHLYQGWINRVTGKIELARNRREEAIRRFHKAADCFKQMEELAEWDATMYEIARMHVEENDLIRAYSILDDLRRYSRQVLDERGIVL